MSNSATPWFLPGPNFGYTLVQIDDHPWNTLITMKEVLRLEPGDLRFQGPAADEHRAYWQKELPALVESGRAPCFVLETKPEHPHRVESTPRQPFRPYDLG